MLSDRSGFVVLAIHEDGRTTMRLKTVEAEARELARAMIREGALSVAVLPGWLTHKKPEPQQGNS